MQRILEIGPLLKEDCNRISEAFSEQGWNKPVAQYESYLALQNEGKRDILVAKKEGCFAGYLTIQWQSDFQDFREEGIPEIVDFNVLKNFQRQGVGTALMDEAEHQIAARSSRAGIGFGLTIDYGAAQILYVKRGYIPWGNGLTMEGRSLVYGDQITVDDSLVFHLSKALT